MGKKVQILDTKAIDAKLLRMAYEIVENNFDEPEIVIAGITDRGLDLAKIIKQKINQISKIKTILITISIDKKNPTNCKIIENQSLDGKSIIVVDDVANSGRTLLYALNPFLNVIAKKILIAVLVDRKHKNYPISPDFVGTSITTTLQEHIEVVFKNGKIEGAYLL